MILFLFGEDAFRSHEKLLTLKQAFFRKNPGSTGFFEFDFADGAKLSELIATLGQAGLFSEKKCVVMKRPFSAPIEVRREFAEFLDRDSAALSKDADRVLIIWESGSVKKNEKLWKALSGKTVRSEVFNALSEREAEQWIDRRILSAGATGIDPNARRALVERCGTNTALLDVEIGKLGAFRFGKQVSFADVELLLGNSSSEDGAFAAIDALFSGRKEMALRSFGLLLETDDPIRLLGACSWQLRNVIRMKSACESGAVRSGREAAKILSLHPFVAEKMFRMVLTLPLQKLLASFSLLARLDLEAKTGERDPKMAILKFVSRF